jgi:predicted permease
MSTLVIVIQIVAPVFILASIGYGWVRMGYDYNVVFVTRLAMTISVPCLIFVALMKAQIDPASLAKTFWAAVAAYVIVTVIFFVVVKLAKLDFSTYMHPLIFGNTGNLGLPLAMFAFGEAGLSLAVVVFAVMIVYSFSLGIWMVSGRGSFGKVLREPTVYGALLGALFMYNGWQTPVWLTNTLQLTGHVQRLADAGLADQYAATDRPDGDSPDADHAGRGAGADRCAGIPAAPAAGAVQGRRLYRYCRGCRHGL